MTTTMDNMRDVISLLKEKSLRERFQSNCTKGNFVRAFARKIGAGRLFVNRCGSAQAMPGDNGSEISNYV